MWVWVGLRVRREALTVSTPPPPHTHTLIFEQRLLLCKLEKSHTELPRVGAVAPSSVPKKHRPLTTEELEDDLADLTSPPLDASDYSELCALLGGVDSVRQRPPPFFLVNVWWATCH